MTDQTTTPPLTREQLRFRREDEMIPKALLMAMGGLVVIALALTTFARVTDRPLVGVPHAAGVVAERQLILDGSKAGDVTVRAADGSVIMALGTDEAGFISVIWRGMDRKRMLHGIEGNPPVRLIAYDNGRLSIEDAASGWSAELGSFGDANEASFAALLP